MSEPQPQPFRRFDLASENLTTRDYFAGLAMQALLSIEGTHAALTAKAISNENLALGSYEVVDPSLKDAGGRSDQP